MSPISTFLLKMARNRVFYCVSLDHSWWSLISAASHGVSERVQPMKREQRLQHVAPYEDMREDFPRPIIAHRPVLNQAYWGAWWLMDFNTEHRPGLPTIEPDYISAAYGTMAFSWDTSTMLLFARYGWRTAPNHCRDE